MMDEEASIQDFLIKRHKWDKVSKKYVLIELLSCLEVDFNYHEPIVQKSMAMIHVEETRVNRIVWF